MAKCLLWIRSAKSYLRSRKKTERPKNTCWTWTRYLGQHSETLRCTDFLPGSIAKLSADFKETVWKPREMMRLALCPLQSLMKSRTRAQASRSSRQVQSSKMLVEVQRKETGWAKSDSI